MDIYFYTRGNREGKIIHFEKEKNCNVKYKQEYWFKTSSAEIKQKLVAALILVNLLLIVLYTFQKLIN